MNSAWLLLSATALLTATPSQTQLENYIAECATTRTGVIRGDPNDCRRYIYCYRGRAYFFQCHNGFIFDGCQKRCLALDRRCVALENLCECPFINGTGSCVSSSDITARFREPSQTTQAPSHNLPRLAATESVVNDHSVQLPTSTTKGHLVRVIIAMGRNGSTEAPVTVQGPTTVGTTQAPKTTVSVGLPPSASPPQPSRTVAEERLNVIDDGEQKQFPAAVTVTNDTDVAETSAATAIPPVDDGGYSMPDMKTNHNDRVTGEKTAVTEFDTLITSTEGERFYNATGDNDYGYSATTAEFEYFDEITVTGLPQVEHESSIGPSDVPQSQNGTTEEVSATTTAAGGSETTENVLQNEEKAKEKDVTEYQVDAFHSTVMVDDQYNDTTSAPSNTTENDSSSNPTDEPIERETGNEDENKIGENNDETTEKKHDTEIANSTVAIEQSSTVLYTNNSEEADTNGEAAVEEDGKEMSEKPAEETSLDPLSPNDGVSLANEEVISEVEEQTSLATAIAESSTLPTRQLRDDCNRLICTNNGQYFSLRNGQCGCLCPRGYRGPSCEYVDNFNDCKCLNGGECVLAGDADNPTGYLCRCPLGLIGTLCQHRLSTVPFPLANLTLCSESEQLNADDGRMYCQNAGVCMTTREGVDARRCYCAPDYAGTYCEVKCSTAS